MLFWLAKSTGNQRGEFGITVEYVFANNALNELICFTRPARIIQNVPVCVEELPQRITIPYIQSTAGDPAFLCGTESSAKSTHLKLCRHPCGCISGAENCIEREVAKRFGCADQVEIVHGNWDVLLTDLGYARQTSLGWAGCTAGYGTGKKPPISRAAVNLHEKFYWRKLTAATPFGVPIELPIFSSD